MLKSRSIFSEQTGPAKLLELPDDLHEGPLLDLRHGLFAATEERRNFLLCPGLRQELANRRRPLPFVGLGRGRAVGPVATARRQERQGELFKGVGQDAKECVHVREQFAKARPD